MRIFKKLTITLALLLTAVTGAWAQSSHNVVEFEVPAAWANDNSLVTAGDLPGFKTSTLAEAQAWKGVPKTGNAVLVYAFDGNTINLVFFSNGAPNVGGSKAEWTKKQVFGLKSGFKFFITAEITEWPLTSQDGKQWTLAKMPASDIELQVEYFAESYLFLSKDALADKASIAVTAGELGVQFGEDGKSATTVTEGTAMTVKYNGTKKVIGVKAEKKKAAEKTIKIDGQDYTVLNGETWKQFITRNQLSGWSVTNATIYTWVVFMNEPFSELHVSSDGNTWEQLVLSSQDAPIDTDKQYKWVQKEQSGGVVGGEPLF